MEPPNMGRTTATGITAAPDLRVRLFGELDLRLHDRQLGPLPSARAASLLGYLVLHAGVPHARQRIAFLLWPDSSESQARTNLRNVLHLLRRAVPALEPFLEVTPRTLVWRDARSCWVDVAEFAAAQEQARRCPPESDDRITALRAVVELYTGDLLEACYDEWLIEERERMRDRYLWALRQLTEELARAGGYAEAVRVGRELIRRDQLNEDHHRLLIDVHNAAGDRAGAVRLFHQCATLLRQELSVEPTAATRDALARVMQSSDFPAGEGQTQVEVRGPVGALVGRKTEWADLTACWRDAEEGRSGFVLVTGEPGVGKTRLVEELSSWCAHRGAVVGVSRSYPAEGDLGYGVVIPWLRTPKVMAQVQRMGTPADLAELGRILPELRNTAHGPPQTGEDADQRLRLFESIARALTSTGPILLVADDAHWSDEPSLQLIHYVLRTAPHSAVLVVATARREEIDARHPLAILAGAMDVLERKTEIHLDRLTIEQTAELAAQLGGTCLDAASAAHLHAETEGNALFVVEAVRAGWTGVPGRAPLTPKLQAVIHARLNRLSDPARQVLGVAATVGRAFTAELIAPAVGLDEVALVQALDELWRRDVIREHEADSYDFSHGKVRDAAYDALSPAARRRNHLLVADALVAAHGPDLDSVSGQVAANYDRAGRPDEAAQWYQRAGAHAMARYAYTEAVRFLERAHILVRSDAAAGRVQEELAIVSMLTTALTVVDGYACDRLAATQRRGIELATILHEDPPPSLLRSLVLAELCGNQLAEARASAGRLLSSAARLGDDVLGLEARYLQGVGAFWSADLQAARDYLSYVVEHFDAGRRAEHLLRFGQDPSVVCMSRLANTLWFLGQPEEARTTQDAALVRSRDPFHPYTSAVALTFALVMAADLEDHDAFVELFGQATALSLEREPSPVMDINLSAMRGYADALEGRGAQGIEGISAAIDATGSANPAPGFRSLLLRLLVGACAVAGDADAGLAASTEALREPGTRLWDPEIRRLRAEFLSARGAPPHEVAAELERGAAVASSFGALGPLRRIQRNQVARHAVG